MGIEVLIPLFGIFSVLLVPILGITVILTTRFALKPLAETLASALRDSGQFSSQGVSLEVRELTEQVRALSDEVQRLREVQEFDQKLLSSKAPGR
jgi:hypothetical protein